MIAASLGCMCVFSTSTLVSPTSISSMLVNHAFLHSQWLQTFGDKMPDAVQLKANNAQVPAVLRSSLVFLSVASGASVSL